MEMSSATLPDVAYPYHTLQAHSWFGSLSIVLMFPEDELEIRMPEANIRSVSYGGC